MSMQSIHPKHIEIWPIERPVPYARNARTHSAEQVAQIAASIVEFGFTMPLLVDRHSVVIAGNARLLAARKLNLTHVPVIILDHLTDAQRRAYVLADNRLAENAGWDEEMLAVEIATLEQELFNLELLGFNQDELARLLAAQDAAAGLTDEDTVPEVPEAPITLLGDLWILDDHRVLCGDAKSESDAHRLMAGDAADLVFTDPPYNCNYQGYTADHLTIQGDNMSAQEFRQFLASVFASYRAIIKPGASLYVCHSSSWQREFQNALEAAGFAIRCQIIWAKDTFAWGFARYKFQHEPIFYCHVAGESDSWYGDKSQSTLWQENKPSANRIHPCMKPVELIERAIQNSSRSGEVVLDGFAGSGSVLIACQKTRRRARLVEIDPRYVDVIVRRWQAYTGHQATLEGDGRAFDEIAVERHTLDPREQPGRDPDGAMANSGLESAALENGV